MNQEPYVPNVGEEFGYDWNEVAYVSAHASHVLVGMLKTDEWAYDFIQEALANGYVNPTWDSIVELTCGFIYLNGEPLDPGAVEYYSAIVIKGLAATIMITEFQRTNQWRALDYTIQDSLTAIEETFSTMRQSLNNLFNQNNNRGRGGMSSMNQTQGSARRGGGLSSLSRGTPTRGGFGSNNVQGYNGGSRTSNAGLSTPRLSLGSAAGGGTARSYQSPNRGVQTQRGTIGAQARREPPRARFNDYDTATVDNATTYTPPPRRDQQTQTTQVNQGNGKMRIHESNTPQNLQQTVYQGAQNMLNHITTEAEAAALYNQQMTSPQSVVKDETRAKGKELRHLIDGKSVLLIKPIDAEESEEQNYPNLFSSQFAPVTAGDVQVFYVLDKNRNIIDMLVSEEDEMVKEDHETARFFTAWGNKTGIPDIEETSKTLVKLQKSARVDELEKQLVAKYGLDTDDEELPEKLVDMNTLHVVDSTQVASINGLNDDLVSVGRNALFASIDNEKLKSSYLLSNIGGVVVPTNFHVAALPDWTLNGEAGAKAMELIGLKTHSSIRRKLFELAEIVDSNLMKLIDKIATDWLNEYAHKQLGYDYGFSSSYMADVEEFIDWIEKDDNTLYTAFCGSASLLVSTVLKPLDTNNELVKEKFDLEGDAWDDQVIFADISNITLVNIDSDDFSANINTHKGIGSISRKTWASMWLVCKNLFGLCSSDVNKVLIVTRDNCKMQISRTYLAGEYSIAVVK